MISKILNGKITSMDGLPEDLKANELLFFKYAPLTSVFFSVITVWGS